MPEDLRHVAIVMDGNGRWAAARHMPRFYGHRAGAKAVRKIVELCADKNIEVLTLFAFSLENRSRPQSEIDYLMSLFFDTLKRDTPKLNDNNVRLRIIGDRQHFAPKLLSQITQSEQLTCHNTGLNLVIAINYSGRWDITQAVQSLFREKSAEALCQDVNQEMIQSHLCLADLPEPDLLIRTSGEQRLSNFMLWQFAYTEIFFTPVKWPDFDAAVFEQALDFYQSRQRRFGLTAEQLEQQHA